MTGQLTNFTSLFTFNRDSGSTYVGPDGNVYGVDWAATSAITATTGSKTFTIPTNRNWKANDKVYITPEDKTANMLMKGDVVSYSGTSLVVNITSTGSDTTTTKTSWRIGNAGPVVDCDQTSLTNKGLRLERSRTNLVPNSEGVGGTLGVIGSGGALPTGWLMLNFSGVSARVTDIGTERGVPYVEIRLYGTTTGTSVTFKMTPSPLASGYVAATPGDLFRYSFWAKIVTGGSNISQYNMRTSARDASNTNLTTFNKSISPGGIFSRYCHDFVMNRYEAVAITPEFGMVVPNGQYIDVTLRIGGPQLEKVRTPSHTGTAQAGASGTITLAAGASSTTDFYAGMSVTTVSGTGLGQTKTITAYNGTTKVATISGTFSPAPDATTTYSVYSTQESSSEGPSTLIPTRSVTETRQPDDLVVTNVSSCYSQNSGTLILSAYSPPYVNPANTSSSVLVEMRNGGGDNVFRVSRSVAGHLKIEMVTGGVTVIDITGPSWSMDSLMKLAVSWGNTGVRYSVDGAAVVSVAKPGLGYPLCDTIRVGASDSSGSNGWDGTVQLMSMSKIEVPDSDLVRLAT